MTKRELADKYALFTFGRRPGLGWLLAEQMHDEVYDRVGRLDQEPITKVQLNQLLVISQAGSVSDGFFQFYWKHVPSHTYDIKKVEFYDESWTTGPEQTIVSHDHFRWGLTALQRMLDLQSLQEPGLDSYPDEPFVSINPAASGRQVSDAIAKLLRQWKEQRGLAEERVRSAKYLEYLKVWDLREGWQDGAYDRTKERTLREIAGELGTPVPSVNNHCRSAFELITGHPYSPEIWCQLFGVLKRSRFAGTQSGRVSQRRPLKSPTVRPVPEAVISPGGDDQTGAGLVSSQSDPRADQASAELLHDILELIKIGRSNQEIIDSLELPGVSLDDVEYLRGRQHEFSALNRI